MEELKKLLNDWWNKWGSKGDRWSGEWIYEEYKKDFQQLTKVLLEKKFKEEDFRSEPFYQELKEIFRAIASNRQDRKSNVKRKFILLFVKKLMSKSRDDLFSKIFYEDKNLYSPKGLTADLASIFGDLNSTQLRRIFERFKNLKNWCKKGLNESELEDLFKEVYSIYPLLAYAKGRKLIPDEFHKLLVYLLGRVEKYRDESLKHPPKCYLSDLKNELCNLVAFIHSFLAYHKFYHANK